MRRLPVSLCFPLAAAAASLSACDLFYPEVTDDRLVMIVPLNPDWYAEVDGTSATVSVPDYAIDQATDPLILDVAALSEEFHAYLTSGTGGSRLSVPPVQNIENGFGFVGAMRVRSLTVESR